VPKKESSPFRFDIFWGLILGGMGGKPESSCPTMKVFQVWERLSTEWDRTIFKKEASVLTGKRACKIRPCEETKSGFWKAPAHMGEKSLCLFEPGFIGKKRKEASTQGKGK